VSGTVVMVHQMTNVLLCIGLASMAVGLGATMPNFSESSPSKIAAGFGGTLNLVLSAIYIILIVVLTALPCHFYQIAEGQHVTARIFNPFYLKLWLFGGTGLAILLGTLATVIPLRNGIRAFNRLEFY
jgi:ABC-2 type transport system permease protein